MYLPQEHAKMHFVSLQKVRDKVLFQQSMRTVEPGLIYAAYENRAPEEKAALCIVHGVGERILRYGEFADTLAQRGYSVFGGDLQGHGVSPGPRGHVGSRETVCKQIDDMVNHALTEMRGKPVFLFGHSMGGLLVLYYRHVRPDSPLAGYVTSSPWLGLTKKYSMCERQAFAKIADADETAVFKPELHQDFLFHKEEGRHVYKDDTLHTLISYRNVVERLEDIDLVFASADVDKGNLYIMAGEEDPICVCSVIAHYAELCGDKATMRAWPGMRHEPWNEPERAQVLGEMMDWMDNEIAEKAVS